MSAKHPALAHHFEDLGQQQRAATFGMWIFLGTELMVFGGLFTGYAVYRYSYPEAFAAGSRKLELWFGAVNTLVLLTSSLTMALAVHAVQVGRRRALLTCLLLTIFLGIVFLAIKGFEYHHDYENELVPRFAFQDKNWKLPPAREPVSPEEARTFPRRVELFLMFYYLMTVLHAIHLIAGIGMLALLLLFAWRGAYTPEYFAPIEVGGLYWHFVDVVWIFLLPLLYLVR